MKKVSVAKFRKNLASYLKELPLAIVDKRADETVAIVLAYDELLDLTEIKKTVLTVNEKAEVVEVPVKKSHPGLCKHGSAVGLCKHGCKK